MLDLDDLYQDMQRHMSRLNTIVDAQLLSWTDREPDVSQLSELLRIAIQNIQEAKVAFKTAHAKLESASNELLAEKEALLSSRLEFQQAADAHNASRDQFVAATENLEHSFQESLGADATRLSQVTESLESMRVTELVPIRNQLSAMQSWAIGAMNEKLDSTARVANETNDVVMSIHRDIRGLLDNAAKSQVDATKMTQLSNEKRSLIDQLENSRARMEEVQQQLVALDARYQELLAEAASSQSSGRDLEELRNRITDMTEQLATREQLVHQLQKQLHHERLETVYLKRLGEATAKVATEKIVAQYRLLMKWRQGERLDTRLEPEPPVEKPQTGISPWECSILDVSRRMGAVDVTDIAPEVDRSEFGALLWKAVTLPSDRSDKLWLMAKDTTWSCMQQMVVCKAASKSADSSTDVSTEAQCACLPGNCIQLIRDSGTQGAIRVRQI